MFLKWNEIENIQSYKEVVLPYACIWYEKIMLLYEMSHEYNFQLCCFITKIINKKIEKAYVHYL